MFKIDNNWPTSYNKKSSCQKSVQIVKLQILLLSGIEFLPWWSVCSGKQEGVTPVASLSR